MFCTATLPVSLFFSLGCSGVNCIALLITGTPRGFFQMLQNTDFFNLGVRLTVVGVNPHLVGVKVGRKGKFIVSKDQVLLSIRPV